VSGERDLDRLLRGMQPQLRAGHVVFVSVQQVPAGVHPVAWVHEDEGTTLVLEQNEADRRGLTYDFVAAMITLQVHSSLDAVGLTAAVSGALADAGISANMIAGYFHDHLFVPVDDADRALRLLESLSGSVVTATPGSAGRRSEGRAGPSPSASE
jgi:uncharacterized protein